jgi:antitoxin HicB
MTFNYAIVVSPLSDEDGGGFLAVVPDLIGCMSDGETQEEAIANANLAIGDWIETQTKRGLTVPKPGYASWKARTERENLLKMLKSLTNRADSIEDRMNELAAAIADIEERLEHQESWRRFDDLVGFPEEIGRRAEPRLI